MIVRIGTDFLDFNDNIEIDRKVKLFEEIGNTDGDFSYSFDVPWTAKNILLLGIPLPDVFPKTIYQGIAADLLTNNGDMISPGFIRVGIVEDKKIPCSFFGGNNNWISLLSGNLSEIDMSEFDYTLGSTEIRNSWDNTDGLIFPVVDTGILSTRQDQSIMVEDFCPAIFINTIFNKIFQAASIKVKGDLIQDGIFNKMFLMKSPLNKDAIDDRSCFVKKSSTQIVSPGPDQVITFDDDINFPYFDGVENNYSTSTSRYSADLKMRVRISLTIVYQSSILIPGAAVDYVYVTVNGTEIFRGTIISLQINGTVSFEIETTIAASAYVEVWALAPPVGDFYIFTNSTIKVTPIFIYGGKGASTLPNWTKLQFVSNIINMFCGICDYEPMSRTLTIDLFEKIKTKEPIRIDNFKKESTDFSDFISDFFQKSRLTYEDADTGDAERYNVLHELKYSHGEISIQNRYIEKIGTIFKSDFKAPYAYVNNFYGMSMERLDIIGLQESDTTDFTSVTNNAGYAQINVADASVFEVLGLVRITDSTTNAYNGDRVVFSKGSNFIILQNLGFISNAKGKVTKVKQTYANDNGVYLMVNSGKIDINRFSRLSEMTVTIFTVTQASFGYFNLLDLGLPASNDFRQSLSFGPVDDPLSFQRTMIDTYWRIVGLIANDPTKIMGDSNINLDVFRSITPLRPISIDTKDTANLYYLNLMRGYKGSEYDCRLELIKLS